MSFLNELKPFLTRKGFLLISAGFLGGLMWSFHYIIEFSVLEAAHLGPLFILYHIAAVPMGAFFFLVWSSKKNLSINFILSSTILVMSLISMLLTTDAFVIAISLAIAGFSIGNSVPTIFLMFVSLFTNPRYNGRLMYLVYTVLSITLVLETIIDYLNNVPIQIIYLLITLIFFIFTFHLGRDSSILAPRKVKLRHYFRKDIIPYPVLLLSFFIGFFNTNTYYSAFLILTNTGHLENSSTWNIFVFVIFSVSTLMCIPCGILYDTIGRRWSILIGFYFEAIAFVAFFLVTLFPEIFPGTSMDIFLLLIFPAMAGIGLTLALHGGLMVVMYELAPAGYLKPHSAASMIFFGTGLFMAVIVDTALGPLVTSQPVLLPVVMIFAYFTATTVVFQCEEPLPSKAELDWKQKLEHILVLEDSGVPLYSQPYHQQELTADAALAGGVIVGISTIINEITRASNLKVIKQASYCIMVEQGTDVLLALMVTEELKILRNKMINFVAEFENFFEPFLKDWDGDPKVFKPTKKLIEKYFGTIS